MPKKLKINFICPLCGSKDLIVRREELIQQGFMKEIELDKDTTFYDWTAEKENLVESEVVDVCCEYCHFTLLRSLNKYDSVEECVEGWLRANKMIEEIK